MLKTEMGQPGEMTEMDVRSLEDLIGNSAASAQFKDAVRALGEGRAQTEIRYNRESPPVKVLRLVMKLLEDFPEFGFENLTVQGQSGCSNYAGFAIAQPGSVHFDFEWDCRWRAQQQGWNDYFGDPDQIRAAQAFGYQCFRKLERK